MNNEAIRKIQEVIDGIEAEKNAEIESRVELEAHAWKEKLDTQIAKLEFTWKEKFAVTVSDLKHECASWQSKASDAADASDNWRNKFVACLAENDKKDADLLKLTKQAENERIRLTRAIEQQRDERNADINKLQEEILELRKAHALAVSSGTDALKVFEEENQRLKADNDALISRMRVKPVENTKDKALFKDAAQAIRDRTYQEWDRKPFLGLLARLDEASNGR